MGPILTASGLIFIGGTDDARFRAFDSKTGKLLWTYKLDYSATDTPITYFGKERQAVCGDGRDRRDGDLRSAWWRFPGGVCVIQRK
jgi:glucose dehydrogenase